MKQPSPLALIELGLEVANNVTEIVEKAIPSEHERLIKFEVRKVTVAARAELRARKAKNKTQRLELAAKKEQLEADIERLERGLEIAAIHGLNKDKLVLNIQHIIDGIAEPVL